MLRGTAAELRARAGTDIRARRPHLRGTAARIEAQAIEERHEEGEWSATAGSSPAATEHTHADHEPVPPSTPIAGVPASEVIEEIARQYDLNVDETDRLERLLNTGLLPTIGQVSIYASQ